MSSNDAPARDDRPATRHRDRPGGAAHGRGIPRDDAQSRGRDQGGDAAPRRRGRRSDEEFRRQVHGSADAATLEALDHSAEVDALGTFCPEPVIRTQNRMRDLAAGDILLLLADDRGVVVDIPAWCMSTGNEFLGIIEGPERLRAWVRKA